MRTLFAVAALLGFGLVCGISASTQTKSKDTSTCGHYGTAVDFLSSPSDAATQAKKDEKLVFVLHVSGHFEDPKFT
jgi:hypothetical protein